MFIAIRIFVCIIALMLSILFARDSKKRGIAVFTLLSILIFICTVIPIERYFIKFSSVEESFYYNNSGEITLVINGAQSKLVVAENNESIGSIVFNSSNGKWKIENGLKTKTVAKKVQNGFVIRVFRHTDIDEYYIEVFNSNGGTLTINDAENNGFSALKNYNEVLQKDFYTYYAYIGTVDSQYILTVNDKDYAIEKTVDGSVNIE